MSFVSFNKFAQNCTVVMQPVVLWLVEGSLEEALQTVKYPLTSPNNIRFQLFTTENTAYMRADLTCHSVTPSTGALSTCHINVTDVTGTTPTNS
jgi:hypothetical protein